GDLAHGLRSPLQSRGPCPAPMPSDWPAAAVASGVNDAVSDARAIYRERGRVVEVELVGRSDEFAAEWAGLADGERDELRSSLLVRVVGAAGRAGAGVGGTGGLGVGAAVAGGGPAAVEAGLHRFTIRASSLSATEPYLQRGCC